jgi:hypothetical protein
VTEINAEAIAFSVRYRLESLRDSQKVVISVKAVMDDLLTNAAKRQKKTLSVPKQRYLITRRSY